MQKNLKVERDYWQRAKIAAAEADVSLRVFVEQAIQAACREHDRRKRTVVATTPVTFLEERQ